MTGQPAQIADADGHDLRPDPLEARTPAELVGALRRYRIWAGEPSFRTMAYQAGNKASSSAMCIALGRTELPRLDLVLAVVSGCGGGEKDLREFATAWRMIRFSEESHGWVEKTLGERPVLRPVPDTA